MTEMRNGELLASTAPHAAGAKDAVAAMAEPERNDRRVMPSMLLLPQQVPAQGIESLISATTISCARTVPLESEQDFVQIPN